MWMKRHLGVRDEGQGGQRLLHRAHLLVGRQKARHAVVLRGGKVREVGTSGKTATETGNESDHVKALISNAKVSSAPPPPKVVGVPYR